VTPAARLDAAIVGSVVLLTAGGVVSIGLPALQVQVVAPDLDLVLDSLTTFVTLSVAVLSGLRYRQRAEPIALFQTAAFLVLTLANGLTVGFATAGVDVQAGFSLAAPGHAPLYVFTVTRLLAGALLVLGSLDALRRRLPRWPGFVAGGSALLTLLVIALVEWQAPWLPPLTTAAAVSNGVAGPRGALPAATLLGAALGVITAGTFLWAAGLSRRVYRRDRAVADAYLTVGLVVAAYAQVATALYPGTYTGLVTSGDLLRLIFDLVLLMGIPAEGVVTMRALRQTNVELTRLRSAEAERAALEERARLSRELHDGLAQSLWLAKLKAARLAGLSALDPEGGALAQELGAAIDAGLNEAREAVQMLRLDGAPSGTLRELLASAVDEFADRYGLGVEFECAADLPPLSPRAQAEALRIVHEALTNVRRHADATVVRVRVLVEPGQLAVRVDDNGRGFDPSAVGEMAFGLVSMRERAALIGGELSIASAPAGGTRVRLLVPLARPGMSASAVGQ
jgi:signal transduction histidine kinase